MVYENPGISHIGWDLDDVAYEGRATTILAACSEEDPKYFRERFINECGKEGALSDIDPQKFRYCLKLWEERNRRIETVRDFGAAVTDLRHDYHLFGPEHTKYIKNAILKGISMKDVNEIFSKVVLNEGFEEAVEIFHKREMKQLVFSNASHPVAVYFWKRCGMEYGEGIPVIVRVGKKEMVYEPGMHGRDDVVFAGRVAEPEWDKLEPFRGYLEREGIPLSRVAVIDDNHLGILKTVKNGGGVAVGYRVNDNCRRALKSAKIPILKETATLKDFPEVIRDWEMLRGLLE